jgi:hypothetical protein
MGIVAILIGASVWEWWLVLSQRKVPGVHEAPYVESAYAAGD